MLQIPSVKNLHRFLVLLLGLSLGLMVCSGPARAAEDSQFFPQTGQTVSGKFLEYWRNNGGLATYGYPITAAQPEVDPETGKTFLTQWFERNRFELHPENAGTKYEVLLGLLGKDLRREALAADPDFLRAWPLFDPSQPRDQQIYFEETGHNLRFGFLKYWQQNGGLERFGYPISEQRPEVDPETGKVFMIQWFERARFEYHPENAAPYDILLGLLGNQLKTPRTQVNFLWKIGRDPNGLIAPADIALDPQGNIFVLDPDALIAKDQPQPRIWKFDPEGRPLANWSAVGQGGSNQFDIPAGLAVDRQGNLYVGYNHNYISGQPQSINGSTHIEKYDNQGHFLLRWGSDGRGDGQFGSLYGLAADGQGNIYVLEGSNARVQKFDSQGHFLLKWGSEGSADGQFRSPLGLATDSQNNVYVSDRDNNRIQKFDSQGKFLAKFGNMGSGNGQFELPSGVAVDAQGNIFVNDRSNQRIQKFDSQGKFLLKWGSEGHGDGQFQYPAAIALDPKGNVYVTDQENSRLQKFDGQGQFLQKWSSASFNPALTGFRPYGVDVDSHSNLYVADRANPQLLKFNKTGQFLGQWVYPEQLENAVDVAVDSQDNIYAVSSGYLGSGKSSLVKLDSNGKILLQWSEQAAAQLVNPGALSVDKQGNVFVADQGGYHEQGHIFKFDNQGKLLLKWDIPLGNTPVDLAADANGNVYVALAISGNPRLQKYDSQGKLLQEWSAADRPFGQLGGVTVDGQGNVYTLDLSSQFVYKFDANGRFLLKWLGNQATAETGITLGLFPFPAHPAVDKQGRVYVPNANSQYIYAFHQQ